MIEPSENCPMKFALRAAGAVLLAAAAFHCQAQAPSPAGLWKNIDDDTGKPGALVRITESNGEFTGQIEKLFRKPEEEQNPVCEKCQGARHGQPIIGMAILSGMKHSGERYDGGQILDPANGKTYRCNMTLSADGKQLDVRGYIGVPMLGRTQTWIRVQ
jgi:uncharacterized protein (DUF2147 family)